MSKREVKPAFAEIELDDLDAAVGGCFHGGFNPAQFQNNGQGFPNGFNPSQFFNGANGFNGAQSYFSSYQYEFGPNGGVLTTNNNGVITSQTLDANGNPLGTTTGGQSVGGGGVGV